MLPEVNAFLDGVSRVIPDTARSPFPYLVTNALYGWIASFHDCLVDSGVTTNLLFMFLKYISVFPVLRAQSRLFNQFLLVDSRPSPNVFFAPGYKHIPHTVLSPPSVPCIDKPLPFPTPYAQAFNPTIFPFFLPPLLRARTWMNLDFDSFLPFLGCFRKKRVFLQDWRV